LFELAIDDFRLNLEKLRKLYPVKTICMHGSPLSRYDNKELWEKYDYRDYGIIAEPYFDIDFDEVFYLTDTGRAWNNSSASVRDKVLKGEKVRRSEGEKVSQKMNIEHRTFNIGRRMENNKGKSKFDIKIKSTQDLIEKIRNDELPDKIMMNVHPQRWNDEFVPWVIELVGQNIKNVVKRLIVHRRGAKNAKKRDIFLSAERPERNKDTF